MADFYLIAHDLGTSGTKAALTDLTGCVLATAERNYPVYYSADGGAEQDPQEWWQAIVDTTQEMMAKSKVSPQQIAGMSMSAQMVGTVPVDQDGNPLRRVMIWLDSRAEKEAAYLREVTQLPFIGGKAPSAKVLWIKQNEPEVYARTYKMLDCKDYLQFRMTGVYGTDYTLSSATTMFNPWEMGWWGDVLGAMEVPMEMLPTAMPSTQIIGNLTAAAAAELGLLEGTPVVSGGGDVPCAVIGSGAISEGRVHLYLGTSAWVIAVAPEFNVEAEGITPGIGCDPAGFMLGGEMDNAGGCLKWFSENLFGQEERLAAQAKGISIFQLMDEMAAEIPAGCEGLLFLPWVWGERAPVDDDQVRGGFVNLGLNHSKAHMVRAMLEGIGHHLRWIFETLEKAGVLVREANVIGGGAKSSFWLQLLADVTGVKLLQVEGPLDACARGAAMTAAVGLGYYHDFKEVEKIIRLTGIEYTPDPQKREGYDAAYANFRYIYQPLSDIGKGLALTQG
jgi:xylulokinase